MEKAEAIAGARAPRHRVLRDSYFFTATALILFGLVFWGFGPTFFWTVAVPAPHKTMLSFGGTLNNALFLVHGLVFSAWILLYCVQSALVSARRTALHRRLGQTAAILIPAVILMGVAVSVQGLRIGFQVPGLPDPAFFADSFFPALTFGAFASAGWAQRRDPAAHKRWMLLATMMMTGAAVARIGAISGLFPDWFEPVSLLLAALALWDLISLGSLHRATLWGGLAFLIVDMGAIHLGLSEPWLALFR